MQLVLLTLGTMVGEGSWISGSICFVLGLCICLFIAPLNKLANRLLWVLVSHFAGLLSALIPGSCLADFPIQPRIIALRMVPLTELGPSAPADNQDNPP